MHTGLFLKWIERINEKVRIVWILRKIISIKHIQCDLLHARQCLIFIWCVFFGLTVTEWNKSCNLMWICKMSVCRYCGHWDFCISNKKQTFCKNTLRAHLFREWLNKSDHRVSEKQCKWMKEEKNHSKTTLCTDQNKLIKCYNWIFYLNAQEKQGKR